MYYRIQTGGELAHHGVKGMKWGVRRYQNKDGSLTPAGTKRYSDDTSGRVKSTKAEYKSAKKAYNKSFNKAYNRSIAAWSPSKKHRSANDARWDQALKDADRMNKAKSEYKKAKTAAKAEKKQFKADVKYAKKNGLKVDYETYADKKGNVVTKVSQAYDSRGRKIGKDYADKVMKQASKEQTIKALAGTAAVIAGSAFIENYVIGR